MASSINIKWCKRNLELHSQPVYDLIKEEFPDLEMEIIDCPELQSLCADAPFVLRNNAIVVARDARGLYAKLKRGMSFMTEPALPGTYADVMAKAASQSE